MNDFRYAITLLLLTSIPVTGIAQTNDKNILDDIYKIDKDVQDLLNKLHPGTPVIYENSKELKRKIEAIERKITEKPTYIEDDRVNYYQAGGSQRRAAEAVAVMVRRVDLLQSGYNHFSLPDRRLGLCEKERFRTEPAPGRCTAFRIDANKLATAGHCIKDASDCDRYAFVFGFRYNSVSDEPHQNISADDIYYCKSILARKHKPLAENVAPEDDWETIEVDRKIKEEIPNIKLSEKPSVRVTDNVTVIGHPSGIPLKIAPNGIVTKIEETYFIATTDSFGGNSGSPVFLTGQLESGSIEAVGVLSRGVRDYDNAGECRKVRLCAQDECEGEDISFSHLLLSKN